MIPLMLQKIYKWLGWKQQSDRNTDPMKKYLIVGLGNIGADYADTRHNIGFTILDRFIEDFEASFETAKAGLC
jgi:PTH1 family peptidyl-tRNA hydrolase